MEFNVPGSVAFTQPSSCPTQNSFFHSKQRSVSLNPESLGRGYLPQSWCPGCRATAMGNVNSEILVFICISSASHLHSVHLRSNWADISTSLSLSLVCICNLSLGGSVFLHCPIPCSPPSSHSPKSPGGGKWQRLLKEKE